MACTNQSGTGRARDFPPVFSPANRAMVYEFLSFMFAKNPDEDMIVHLTSNKQISRLKEIELAIGDDRRFEELRNGVEKLIMSLQSLTVGDGILLTRLQEEYARLFRGIKKGYGPPPPYESVYRSGQMMSEHASDVQTLYDNAGLEVRGGEPPDHIGLELAFMAFLCVKEEEHRSAGELESARESTSLQDNFLFDHILKWMPQFCRNVLNYESALYGPVAELTMAWLRSEEKNANDRKPR